MGVEERSWKGKEPRRKGGGNRKFRGKSCLKWKMRSHLREIQQAREKSDTYGDLERG